MRERSRAKRPLRRAGGTYAEPGADLTDPAIWAQLGIGLAAAALLAVCVQLAEVDPGALVRGLPRLAAWASTAWPPYLDDLGTFVWRALETVAIATVGTVVATVLAFPISILMARNLTPSVAVMLPVRWLCNAFRAIDTVIFAILFVAAVGLGPFAGVLGMIVHALGVVAKLNAEAIETLPDAPLEAALMSGAGPIKLVAYAMIPLVIPNLTSNALYVWEANVRTSTILGIVGAGGIGMEIKAAIDLLDFPKLLTLSVIVLLMVTVIDQISAFLRARLV